MPFTQNFTNNFQSVSIILLPVFDSGKGGSTGRAHACN